MQKAFNNLSAIQKTAVDWQDGACLVLAGPGAGKTRVLTTRIARLLDDSPEKKFRILALTYTTKAAAEMRDRVDVLVPGLADERTFIGTFHAFCTEILRSHGSHIGVRPDFGIFGQKEDREALLADAIKEAVKVGRDFSTDDLSLLETIRELKARLITPEKSLSKTKNLHLKEVYELYEASLRQENYMDFEGLILETCRLLATVPAVAARVRQTYHFWMIDEFQDTTSAQYWLLHYLSGAEFKNIFVVADDDQIIYQWAGASYRQIEKLRIDHKPKLIQLVQNHRCPPEVVTMANQLVANNTARSPEKQPTVSSRENPINAITYSDFATDEDERESIISEILAMGEENWGKIVILGRTRSLLQPLVDSLKARGVRAVLSQRRDDFVSPQFVWLQALLDQVIRPTNKRVFTALVHAANRICNSELDPVLLIAEAEAVGESFFEFWAKSIKEIDSSLAQELGLFAQRLAQTRTSWKLVVQDAIPVLLTTAPTEEGVVSDTEEDHIAWTTSMREIRAETGHDPDLSDFVQGIALRSKEPPREHNTVALMTIHSSKGLEFEIVYLLGLAEGEMPSWQSCKKGDASAEMEEERRNCFVAITRTQEKLNLSSAKIYRGRAKLASRFLNEMSIGTDIEGQVLNHEF
ncbi:MAG: ATP-dependent helicase [Candidatus Uhrbacteria bacterium]